MLKTAVQWLICGISDWIGKLYLINGDWKKCAYVMKSPTDILSLENK